MIEMVVLVTLQLLTIDLYTFFHIILCIISAQKKLSCKTNIYLLHTLQVLQVADQCLERGHIGLTDGHRIPQTPTQHDAEVTLHQPSLLQLRYALPRNLHISNTIQHFVEIYFFYCTLYFNNIIFLFFFLFFFAPRNFFLSEFWIRE